MGKKKSKKLNQQQQQQQQPTATTAAVDGLAPLPPPTTQSIALAPQALPPLTPAPSNAASAAQQHDDAADGDGQSKKSKRKQRAKERRDAKKQQLFLQRQQQQQQPALVGEEGFGTQAQQPGFTAEGFDDHPASGHGLRGGGGPPRDFVGQPLLDALDGTQQSGSEAESAHAGGAGRRASLARRPAQQGGGVSVADGPPPGAPTQPRAARNVAEPPLGAPTGPKSMAQAQPRAPKSYAHPPQYWQTPGVSTAEVDSQAPAAAFASYSQAAPGDGNPFGYNVQNATWDWNNAFGGAAANSAETGGLNGGESNAYTSDYQTDTGSAQWPSTYGEYLQQQQFSSPQPFGQVPSVYDAYLHQPMSINYQTGYYPSYYQGSSDGGMRYIYGHTNSFAAPFTPAASVQHYYQGHSWHVDKGYSASTTRGFSTTAAAQKKKNPQIPHPSQRRWSENSSDGDGGVMVGQTPQHIRNQTTSIQLQAEMRAQFLRDQALRREAREKALPPWEQQQALLRNQQQRQKTKSPSPNARWISRGSARPQRPKPTYEYLIIAENEPVRLAAPRPLLVVIDLNGTLVHRPHRNKSSRVVRRPYVSAFLDYLLANHCVMVWSSARPENVARMCTQLFAPGDRARLAAEWGRDMLDLTPKQYTEKVQVYKKLSKVWRNADIGKWHPLHRTARNDDHHSQRFGQHNTLLIDDSVLKASSEPHNLVCVEEFEGRPEQMQTDVLRQVVAYLEEAKWMANVSAWIRAGNAFEADTPRWQDYAWPDGTRPDAVPDGVVMPGEGITAGGAAGAGFDEWMGNFRKTKTQEEIEQDRELDLQERRLREAGWGRGR